MFKTISNKVLMAVLVVMALIGTASAAIDFTAITDLLNVTFDVLDIIVGGTSTLISVVVLFAVIGLVGIIVYGFIGKLLTKITGKI